MIIILIRYTVYYKHTSPKNGLHELHGSDVTRKNKRYPDH
jgi:hypothetical protein